MKKTARRNTQRTSGISIQATWCVVACFLGLLLVGLSYWWQTAAAGRLVWTEADAQQYNAAAGKLHQITYEHAASQGNSGKMLGGMHRAVSDGELAAAQDAWDQQKNRLDNASRYLDLWTNGSFYIGIGLVVCGMYGFLIARNRDEDK